jgi:hypothetical protein
MWIGRHAGWHSGISLKASCVHSITCASWAVCLGLHSSSSSSWALLKAVQCWVQCVRVLRCGFIRRCCHGRNVLTLGMYRRLAGAEGQNALCRSTSLSSQGRVCAWLGQYTWPSGLIFVDGLELRLAHTWPVFQAGRSRPSGFFCLLAAATVC